MQRVLYIFYISTILLIGFTSIFRDENVKFIVLTVSLLGYNIIELIALYKRDSKYFFINPILFAVVFTFFLALGGISNFFSIRDGVFQIRDIAPLLDYERFWMNTALTYICLASVCCWLGYKSNLGIKLFNFIIRGAGMQHFYKGRPNFSLIIFVAFIAYCIKFYFFSIGLFGRILDTEYYDLESGYKAGGQFRVLGNLSYLTFLLICVQYFKKKEGIIIIAFWVSLILEIIFGFLYGARSAFITPFLIVFITKYYATGKLKVMYVALGISSLLFAITVVLDYKNYVQTSTFVRSSDPIQSIENFLTYNNSKAKDQAPTIKKENGLDFSTIPEAAMAIRYKSLYGLKESDPDFMSSIVLFFYNAFIPRFIQGNKEPPWGLWYKNEVLNYQTESKYNITITSIGFLYLAGGPLMVFIGFFIYGVLLRMTFSYLDLGLFGFITFISLLNYLYTFDSIFSGVLTNVTREVFIYPIIYFYLLKSRSVSINEQPQFAN